MFSNSSGRTACLLCQLQKNGPNAKTWNFESLEVELLQVSIWSLNCFEQIWVLPSRILGMLKWFLGDVQPANIKSNQKFKIHFSTAERFVCYRHYKGKESVAVILGRGQHQCWKGGKEQNCCQDYLQETSAANYITWQYFPHLNKHHENPIMLDKISWQKPD